EMRERGQVQGYHEVSRDRTTWQALDLVPQLRQAPPPPPPTYAAPRERVRERDREAPAARTSPWANRQYQLIVGGVLVLLVGGVITAGVLSQRSRTSGGGSGGGGSDKATVAEGAISFTSQTPRKEREELLRKVVGLVVPGLSVTHTDGRKQEI